MCIIVDFGHGATEFAAAGVHLGTKSETPGGGGECKECGLQTPGSRDQTGRRDHSA